MEGGTEMIAPDKIWINTDTLNGYYMSNHPSCGEEYIRKDALMERLKNVAAEYKKRSDEGELVWQNMCGINEAINIINEI